MIIYSSWTYFTVLTFISFNIILCLWFVLKSNKQWTIGLYISDTAFVIICLFG